MELWLEYGFPGNVRELRNIVIRLTTKYAGQTVNVEQLQAELDMESVDIELPRPRRWARTSSRCWKRPGSHLQSQKNFNLDNTLQQWEKGYVEAALMITQGNLSPGGEAAGHPPHHAL